MASNAERQLISHLTSGCICDHRPGDPCNASCPVHLGAGLRSAGGGMYEPYVAACSWCVTTDAGLACRADLGGRCPTIPVLTPSADLPACRDEDPAYAAALTACYPPDYQHPEDDDEGAFDMAPGHGGW